MTYQPEAGATLAGKYLLERVLGEGGMGVVFAARHLRLDRPVAIKFLHAPMARNDGALRRFLDEARAAGRLRHPNVIDVLDVDEEQGTPFMVMEMLDGEPLSALLERRGPLHLDEALAILLPVFDGVAAAHAQGVVHRDLKPDNVFLANEGGRVVPKVLDFGIARQDDTPGSATATGAIIGTPVYMAPEQARGIRREIGPWTDVWALGVICFQCLTGRMHFDFDPQQGVMGWIVTVSTTTPRSAREFLVDGPAHVVDALDAALSVEPQSRLPSVAALRAALLGEPLPEPAPRTTRSGASGRAGEGSSAAASTPATRIPATVDSNPGTQSAARSRRVASVLGAAIVVATLLSLTMWAAWQGLTAPAREPTPQSAHTAPAPSLAVAPSMAEVADSVTEEDHEQVAAEEADDEDESSAAATPERPLREERTPAARTPRARADELESETSPRETRRTGVETRTGEWRIDDM